MSIEEEEMEELLKFPPPHVQYYRKEGGAYEVVGYTKQRKFLSVTFTLEDARLVIEDVNLPSYETIQDVILRQLAAGGSPFHDR
ncbi:hypothetical protein [Hymenobacter sp. B81]|uniref:hypothetical protein n=1 Tax=Hymenobacter sp. B81 TaxID=3344878 RepID=UPI0037DDACC9